MSWATQCLKIMFRVLVSSFVPLLLNFFNTKDTKECTKERKGKAIVTMVKSKFYTVFHLE